MRQRTKRKGILNAIYKEEITKCLTNRVDFKTALSLLADAEKEFKTKLESIRKQSGAEIKEQEFLEKSFDLNSWYSRFRIKSELEKQAETEKKVDDNAVQKTALSVKPGGNFRNGWRNLLMNSLEICGCLPCVQYAPKDISISVACQSGVRCSDCKSV